MDIPRFVRSELNPDLVADHTDGDAYQLFMYDILRGDFPDLRSYATAGKDGAIDLARSAPDGGRQIFECKFVGSDDQKEVKRRWAEVADKLDRNLAKPEGPPTGQSQYGTWYVPEPITVYYFCTSSLYSNETAYQELKSEIDQFFVELAQRPHLEHLRGIRVHAESWAQTSDRLRRCPTVLLRWFRRPRETRVRPFDEPAPPRSFREYLSPDHLPYYRRSDHLRANPAPLALGIRDEEQLLADLDRTDVTGLLLTGTGGLGKTRLMIELGRMARDLGWSVLRVADAWDILDLRRFADMIDPEARVLLLFDYIERQNVFAAIAHEIQEINSARFLNLRYIANCRTSYWGRSRGGHWRHGAGRPGCTIRRQPFDSEAVMVASAVLPPVSVTGLTGRPGDRWQDRRRYHGTSDRASRSGSLQLPL